MFLEIDKKNKSNIAFIDSGGIQVTYGEIVKQSGQFYEAIKKRTLIFILSRNCAGAALGYLCAMVNRVVPLILSATMDKELLETLIKTYHPEYIWKPLDMFEYGEDALFCLHEYGLAATGMETYPLYPDLSLLLTTSGSTGSPKLVRHSYNNLEAQAKNISTFFELDEAERAMLDLPINYTMGLSILNSHLYSGATVLLTSLNVLHPDYWKFFKEQQATSFTNVPYSFEILKKLRFFNMNLPSLKTLSQGGGKLSGELQKEFAEYANNTGRRFILTYGQTEGSARMAYLPAEYALEKCGSIGRAIPNGELYLVDEEGNKITMPGIIGEMVYKGPNVTLGYAQSGEDLILGDERCGVLYTGDMVKVDEDGFFYIVGRKKRFLKLCGYRVGLDECENLIKSAFETECACTGNDEYMHIYVTIDKNHHQIKHYIADKININSGVFQVHYIEKIPRNEAGKILYHKLQ
ncbi:AMP-binding protein [Parablautia muri]|uniref:O-succinylbenzoate--CoA ligase n=1 Tax=Parablautia muri TaxID=2320879 RepID=A0A9X5BFB4_9FIRM|nr:AMP-binding protein [Parablautia muri]NBJ92669.1 o-succinylbenzoate--CoA ligase [Parablautia muri]